MNDNIEISMQVVNEVAINLMCKANKDNKYMVVGETCGYAKNKSTFVGWC